MAILRQNAAVVAYVKYMDIVIIISSNSGYKPFQAWAI